MDWLVILPGFLAGAALWFVAIRPYELRQHERRRRSLGLPPERKLPEDKTDDYGVD